MFIPVETVSLKYTNYFFDKIDILTLRPITDQKPPILSKINIHEIQPISEILEFDTLYQLSNLDPRHRLVSRSLAKINKKILLAHCLLSDSEEIDTSMTSATTPNN